MQPITNKCRCCLQEGEHAHNIYDDLYMDVFKETLNLLPTRDSRLPHWMCSGCVNSLKEVKRFRDMVTASERLLLQTITTTICHLSEITVWIKEEPRYLDADDGDHPDEESTIQPSESVPSLDDAEIKMSVPDTPHEIDLRIGTKHDRKRKKLVKKDQLVTQKDDKKSESNNPFYDVKEERTRNENVGYSSDTHGNKSESASTTKQFPTKQQEIGPTTPSSVVIVPDVGTILGNFTPEQPVKDLAETSNTKRRLTGPTKLRENIILLMQYSTIVPFRHNSNFINDYICYYCENNYKTMKELKEHTESEHVGKVNDEAIMTLMRTRAHKLINADISSIKCRLCCEKVNNIELLIQHLTKVHKKVYHDTGKRCHGIVGFELSTDELKCHLCNNKFESFRSLFSHMNDHYEGYICFCCQKKFVNQLRYRTHLKTHIIREVSEFKCDDCGAICKTKTGLVYHMKRYHLNVILKCERCPETFRFKEYRKRDEHMVEVHGMKRPDNKYTCDICQNGKVYSSKNTLKIHKSNVHKVGDVLRIKCEMCEFVTHHTKRMKEHMDIHNGVKNHGCDLCGKRFTKPYTLRVHMRMHLNDKRHACTLCEAAFVHKNVLQHHMKKMHPSSDITV